MGTEKASRQAKPAQAVSAGVAADTTVMTRNRKVVISTYGMVINPVSLRNGTRGRNLTGAGQGIVKNPKVLTRLPGRSRLGRSLLVRAPAHSTRMVAGTDAFTICWGRPRRRKLGCGEHPDFRTTVGLARDDLALAIWTEIAVRDFDASSLGRTERPQRADQLAGPSVEYLDHGRSTVVTSDDVGDPIPRHISQGHVHRAAVRPHIPEVRTDDGGQESGIHSQCLVAQLELDDVVPLRRE